MLVLSRWLVLLITLSIIMGLGIYYLGYKPDISRFKISVDIAKTTYKVGEEIAFEPYLIYQGSLPLLPVKIRSSLPLYFYLVYNMEDSPLDLPYYPIRVDIIVPHLLYSRIPYRNGDLRKVHLKKQDIKPFYHFTLDKPGDYKIEIWAEFSPHFNTGISGYLKVYAEPIWIEVLP